VGTRAPRSRRPSHHRFGVHPGRSPHSARPGRWNRSSAMGPAPSPRSTAASMRKRLRRGRHSRGSRDFPLVSRRRPAAARRRPQRGSGTSPCGERCRTGVEIYIRTCAASSGARRWRRPSPHGCKTCAGHTGSETPRKRLSRPPGKRSERSRLRSRRHVARPARSSPNRWVLSWHP
jgi:hypothetical protein